MPSTEFTLSSFAIRLVVGAIPRSDEAEQITPLIECRL